MKFLTGLLTTLSVVGAVIGIVDGIRTLITAKDNDAEEEKKLAYQKGWIEGYCSGDKKLAKYMKKNKNLA